MRGCFPSRSKDSSFARASTCSVTLQVYSLPLCQGPRLGSHPTVLEVPCPITVAGSSKTTSLRAGSSSRSAGQSYPRPGDHRPCTGPMELSLPTLKGPRPCASSPTELRPPLPTRLLPPPPTLAGLAELPAR